VYWYASGYPVIDRDVLHRLHENLNVPRAFSFDCSLRTTSEALRSRSSSGFRLIDILRCSS